MAFYFAFFNVSNANQELRDRRARSQREKEKRRHSEASLVNHQTAANDFRVLPRPRVVSSHSIRPPTPPRRSSTPDEQCCETTAATCALGRQRSPESRNKKVTFEQLSASREQLINHKRKFSESAFLENRQVWRTMEELDETGKRPWVYSIELPAPASTPDVEYIKKTEGFQKRASPFPLEPEYPTTSSSTTTTTAQYVHSKKIRGESPVWIPRATKNYRRESAPFAIYGQESSVDSSSNNESSSKNESSSTNHFTPHKSNTWPPPRKNWRSRLLRRRSTTDRSRSPASLIRYEPIPEVNLRPNFLPIQQGNRRFRGNFNSITNSISRRSTHADAVPLIRREQHFDVTEAEVTESFEFTEMKKLVESNIF